MSSAAQPTVNVVVDLSHWNAVSTWQEVIGDGIKGIVHKATQGLQYVDPLYSLRHGHAVAAGLWWGGYHFGEGGNAAQQADHYLDTIQPDAKTLLVLDLERNPQGPSMTLTDAEQFVSHVHDRTGRWPMLYTGTWYIREIIPDKQTTVLSNCPLWIASYQSTPNLPSQWTTWHFWQYTDGHHGPQPYTVSGIGACDRDMFNGTLDQLAAFWGVGA